VKTGIQDRKKKIWIPASASAGMTTFLNQFLEHFQNAELIEDLRFIRDL